MRKILIIMGILSLTSCVITFPGTRYKHLTEDQKKRVVVCNAPVDSLANDGKVYLVTIEQMQKFLKAQNRVLIYEYASFCQSDHCVNPAVIENTIYKRYEKRNSTPSAVVGHDAHAANSPSESPQGIRHHQRQ